MQNEPFQLLYDHIDFVAVAKPAGLTCVPARGEAPQACLQHRLQEQLGSRLWVVHRLDRDTTGVVVLARHAAAHRRLGALFETRQVQKTYHALVRGLLHPPHGRIDTPLHSARKGKMRPAAATDKSGVLACSTSYRILEIFHGTGGDTPPIAWVEVMPHTGRQHQIRVHLRSAGAPLLVDPLYGGVAALPHAALGWPSAGSCDRLTLHATRLEFVWREGQGSTRRIDVTAPLPEDLAQLLALLRRPSLVAPG